MNTNKLAPWDYLAKQMICDKLSYIKDKKVLDFGSGLGYTANHFAKCNEVFAIEPDIDSVNNRITINPYNQVHGSTDALKKLDNQSFDVILCHNVLEYIDNKEEIINVFNRLLKPNGQLSIVKHNRAGRVMQMVTLLNNFEHANELLNGDNGRPTAYGAIRYYEDDDIIKWADNLKLISKSGIRCFWHLQQNQEIHTNSDWQKEMMNIEKRVSEIPQYMDVAMFHHLIYKKDTIQYENGM